MTDAHAATGAAARSAHTAPYEAVIGLEIHVQLATATKLFCGDRNEFGAPPNTHVCPVCLGLPGALPVTNAHALELCVRAGLGLGCDIHETSVFARKNYFYPDLPKGYQITQFDRPVATGGGFAVTTPAGEHFVRLRRIHLEEDAGKSIHDRIAGATAVDLNRAGVPLIEIVTEPDLRAPADVRAFLTRLKQILQYLEVSDCDMEKGSLRVDANVSVRPASDPELGTKTELKNMNSFAHVERALVYEIERQIETVRAGGRIEPQTLLWDERKGEARVMRAKEESHDYRYFPDPDLPPVVLPAGTIDRVRADLPELPSTRERRFQQVHGLPAYDAEVLCADRAVADYFEAVAAAAGDAKAASNWVMTDVLGWRNQNAAAMPAFPTPPARLAELIVLVQEGVISHSVARTVFQKVVATGTSARSIVQAEGLAQVRDDDQLERWVAEVIAACPAEVARYRAGETKVQGFLMGQIMQRSQGKADPRRVTELLRLRLQA